MPIIARFYGMVVKMYYFSNEHNPPHIHVIYGDYVGVLKILDGEMLQGDLPIRALKIVKEWVNMHSDELLEMWNTQEFKVLSSII